MTSNERLLHKLNQIRSIQAKGYRVFIAQSGRVTLWRKGKPEQEWIFRDLEQALEVCK